MVARSGLRTSMIRITRIRICALRSLVTLSPRGLRWPPRSSGPRLHLTGGSKAQILEVITAAIQSGELPTAEAGSIANMLSRATYLNRRVGHWRPHLMFFTPETDPQVWGGGPAGLPILGIGQPAEHLTVFPIPVSRWSDGTLYRKDIESVLSRQPQHFGRLKPMIPSSCRQGP